MPLLIALFLGIVQGLTEFFPISSSAHVNLIKHLFGVSDVPVIFDLACHLGSLGALLWFFKGEVIALFLKDPKKIGYLFIALLPLIPAYFFLKPLRIAVSRPEFLGFFLMLTSGILLAGQKFRFKKKKRMMSELLFIGTLQSAALIPGISRSASTISAARALGWTAKEAVRFSFLLSIPTILGGNFLEIHHLWNQNQLSLLFNLPCLIGFISSLIVGLGVIRFAIDLLERGKLNIFAWYCLVIGILTSLYMFLR